MAGRKRELKPKETDFLDLEISIHRSPLQLIRMKVRPWDEAEVSKTLAMLSMYNKGLRWKTRKNSSKP